jgi:ketosteroid isomerase-like protein
MLRDSELQELLDRARIADTIYAFCDYCNSGDVEGVVSLFTEDGIFDLGGGATHNGRGELTDMFTDRFALYTTTTFNCSGVRLVRYDGSTAETHTYLYGVHDAADSDRQMHVWGRYEDIMVNESGVWRFQRRDLCVSGLNLTDLQEVPRRFERSDHQPRARRASMARRFEEPGLSVKGVGAVSMLSATARAERPARGGVDHR